MNKSNRPNYRLTDTRSADIQTGILSLFQVKPTSRKLEERSHCSCDGVCTCNAACECHGYRPMCYSN